MYLRRLQVHGFKSFAVPSTLDFKPGVTAVVGPNGSGKSNVADAIRWVLGEQNTRLIRARKSEDVIFAGSSARAPLGLAEVTLVLDNTERWVDVEFAEVALTRRAYRSGENEYFINRNRVRLRDLVDLLLKANVGQNAYTVVGQGLIDEALSQRPEERRALIEEAGDLRRHYHRLKETRDRLDRTIENLGRVEESIVELTPRVDRLAKQAKHSLEHRRLSDELRCLLRAWYRVRRAKLQATAAQLQERRKEQESRLDLEREEIARLEVALAELRQRQDDVRGQLESVREEHASALRRQDQLAQQEELLKERARFLQQQAAELERESEWLETAVAQESAEVESSRARVVDLKSREEHEALAVSEQQQRLTELQSVFSRLHDSVAPAQRALEDRRKRVEATRRALSAAEHGDRVAAEESQRAAVSHRLVLQQVESHRAKLAMLEEEYQASIDEEKRLSVQIAESRVRLTAAERQVTEIQGHLSQASKAMHDLRARQQAIESVQSTRSGLYSGVRAVLTAASSSSEGQDPTRDRQRGASGTGSERGAKLPRLDGVVGIVGDLIQVPRALEVAIETVLGARLQDVVVDRWEAAEAAIGMLKKLGAGRATFLPLDTIKSAPPRVPPPGPGVIGCAARLVKCDQRFSPVVDMLLGQTIVVDSLASGRRLLRGNMSGGQIVTLEGELIRPSGAVTGGSPAQKADAGHLARQREIRELRQRIAEGEREMQSQEKQLEQEQGVLHALQKEMTTLEKKRQEHDLHERVRRLDLERVRQELHASVNEAEKLEKLIASAEAVRDSRVSNRERLEEEMQTLLRSLSEDERSVGRQQSQVSQSQAQLTFEKRRLEELEEQRRRTASTLERESAVLSSREVNRERLRAQLSTKRDRVVQQAEEDKKIESETSLLLGQRQGSRQDIDAVARSIAGLSESVAQLSREETSLRNQEKAGRAQLQEEEHRLTGMVIELERCLARLSQLVQAAEEEGIELGESPDACHPQVQHTIWHTASAGSLVPASADLLADGTDPLTLDADVLRRRSDRLRSQIKEMEPVNPLAPEEHAEARERLDFLTTQSADLHAATKPMQTAIEQLERLIQEQFMTAFQALDGYFRECFSMLFGGGSARLVLTSPDDPSETGLEIIAQPPGKRKQSLSLLSGGERALSGAALLFALLRLRPVPFCVLDEVDAALDEANVGRFRDLLSRMSAQTQFIVITHNRATMEAADTLYGVTMGQDGVSRLISLQMDKRETVSLTSQ